VLIDEAQFLTPQQVLQLTMVCDQLAIPVLCYGLRTDFLGNLFPGSAALLGIADHLIELKTICHCGRKATMNLRVGPDGKALHEGQDAPCHSGRTDYGGSEPTAAAREDVAACRQIPVPNWMSSQAPATQSPPLSKM